MYNFIAKKTDICWIQKSIQNSFSMMYVTMLSIIQGVALSLLAGKVPIGWQKVSSYGIENLVMCLLTLLIIIVLWHSYFWLAVVAAWTPLIWDSLLMFSIGAVELIAVKNICSVAWFYAIALLGILGAFQYHYNVKRIPEESWDNNTKAKDTEKKEENDIGHWIRTYKTKRGWKLFWLSAAVFLVTFLFDIFSLFTMSVVFKWILLVGILVGQVWAIIQHYSDQKETLERIGKKLPE